MTSQTHALSDRLYQAGVDDPRDQVREYYRLCQALETKNTILAAEVKDLLGMRLSWKNNNLLYRAQKAETQLAAARAIIDAAQKVAELYTQKDGHITSHFKTGREALNALVDCILAKNETLPNTPQCTITPTTMAAAWVTIPRRRCGCFLRVRW